MIHPRWNTCTSSILPGHTRKSKPQSQQQDLSGVILLHTWKTDQCNNREGRLLAGFFVAGCYVQLDACYDLMIVDTPTFPSLPLSSFWPNDTERKSVSGGNRCTRASETSRSTL